MSDDPGDAIRARFRATPLPSAPVRLRDRLAAVSVTPAATTTSRFGRARLVMALAAAVAVASIGLIVGGGTDGPSPSPGGEVWGPLAVANLLEAPAARIEGTLELTERCAFLIDLEGVRQVVVWPSDRTTWNAETRTITLRRLLTAETVELREGDQIEFGGGGSSVVEGGLSGDEWAAGFDWVAPPVPECVTDVRWVLSDAGPLTAEATPEPSSYAIVCEEVEAPGFTCAEIVDAALSDNRGSGSSPIIEIVVTRLCGTPCIPESMSARVEVTLGPPSLGNVVLSVVSTPEGPVVQQTMSAERADGPPYGEAPSPETATPIEAVALWPDRMELKVRFFLDPCFDDYTPWVEDSGDRLRVAIAAGPRLSARPSGGACDEAPSRFTYALTLAEPFQGTIVEDISNGQIFEVAPS
jgi:hypothetical protein